MIEQILFAVVIVAVLSWIAYMVAKSVQAHREETSNDNP